MRKSILNKIEQEKFSIQDFRFIAGEDKDLGYALLYTEKGDIYVEDRRDNIRSYHKNTKTIYKPLRRRLKKIKSKDKEHRVYTINAITNIFVFQGNQELNYYCLGEPYTDYENIFNFYTTIKIPFRRKKYYLLEPKPFDKSQLSVVHQIRKKKIKKKIESIDILSYNKELYWKDDKRSGKVLYYNNKMYFYKYDKTNTFTVNNNNYISIKKKRKKIKATLVMDKEFKGKKKEILKSDYIKSFEQIGWKPTKVRKIGKNKYKVEFLVEKLKNKNAYLFSGLDTLGYYIEDSDKYDFVFFDVKKKKKNSKTVKISDYGEIDSINYYGITLVNQRNNKERRCDDIVFIPFENIEKEIKRSINNTSPKESTTYQFIPRSLVIDNILNPPYNKTKHYLKILEGRL